MPPQVLQLFLIIGLAVILFSGDWVPAEVVALGVMLAIVLTGLLPAERAFAGFGSDAVMLILGLLILIAALLRTGVVDAFGRSISRYADRTPLRLLLIATAPVAILSSFISNTASTAFFLPIIVGLSARTGLPASSLLMPLSFAAILASSVTLLGSSTNIVVSGLMTQSGLAPISMFELAPVGVPIAAAGVLYLLVVGRHLIPIRSAQRMLTEEFGIRQYVSELLIRPDSKLAGKTLAESGLGSEADLTVLQLVRDSERRLTPRGNTKLQAGDLLLVEGERENILRIQDIAGIDIKGDVEVTDPDLESEEIGLAEVILLPRSPLIGRTLTGVRFRERYGLQVLAVNRRGGTIKKKVSNIRLKLGDVLLVQGDRTSMAALNEETTFHILGEVEPRRLNVRRAPAALAIFIAALGAATLNLVSLPVAVLAGAVLVFVTRSITPEEAYRLVEWKVLILIGSMLAVGAAMEHTGTAQFLARQIVSVAGVGPVWLLSAFFVLTVVLTQPMSNQAAAAVIVPIALQTALQLDLNPRTFAMMITVAASTSFITPLEPACLMVYGPGRYRFFDFLRVGGPLTVVIYLIAILLVPRVWPL